MYVTNVEIITCFLFQTVITIIASTDEVEASYFLLGKDSQWLLIYRCLHMVLSLVPRPRPLTWRRVWWLLSDFLVVPTQQYWFWTTVDYMLAWCRPISLVYAHTWMMWHYFIGLSKIKTVDSAQPRNRSIVTDPFPCESCGLGTRLHGARWAV